MPWDSTITQMQANAEVTLRKQHLQLLVGLGKKLFKSNRLVWLEKCPTLKPYTFLLSPTNKCVLCIDVLHSFILDTCIYIYIYIYRERERERERKRERERERFFVQRITKDGESWAC